MCAPLCVVHLNLIDIALRETVTSQPPEYAAGDTVCAADDKTPQKEGGTTKAMKIAITQNRQLRRREKGLLRQEEENLHFYK